MGRNIVGSTLIRAVILVVAIAVKPPSVSGQTDNTELALLRHRLALQYLEPAPHIALAKYFWARGDRLQAFYLLEYARRARFPGKKFDLAFAKGFGGPQQSQTGLAVFNNAVELQRAEISRQPRNPTSLLRCGKRRVIRFFSKCCANRLNY